MYETSTIIPNQYGKVKIRTYILILSRYARSLEVNHAWHRTRGWFYVPSVDDKIASSYFVFHGLAEIDKSTLVKIVVVCAFR